MKKPMYWIGLAGLMTALTIAPVGGRSLLSRLVDAGATVAQNVQNKPVVNLVLSAEKKVDQSDSQVTWQALSGQTVVQPGNVLRYIVTGTNSGNVPAKNLTITQPVPRGIVYVPKSATVSGGEAVITFSIDGGKRFTEAPTIQLVMQNGAVENRSVPAEAYTHVRWKFESSLAVKAVVTASYEVRVR